MTMPFRCYGSFEAVSALPKCRSFKPTMTGTFCLKIYFQTYPLRRKCRHLSQRERLFVSPIIAENRQKNNDYAKICKHPHKKQPKGDFFILHKYIHAHIQPSSLRELPTYGLRNQIPHHLALVRYFYTFLRRSFAVPPISERASESPAAAISV